ncbi:MAG: HEAT repeat domain-containing protein, partial [Phycisphaerae bacterium]
MLHGHDKLAGLVLLMMMAGCAQSQWAGVPVDRMALKHRALDCLKAAVRYEHNPVVRVEAVEALQSSRYEQGLPWIRTALLDEHPAVRFAACVAIGRLGDAVSERTLQERVDDEDACVQVAALFALHRLGHAERTGRMPTYLLQHEDVSVRRNAAL